MKLDLRQVRSNNAVDYVTRRFNASSAELSLLAGCTFAETPLNAISRPDWSPNSAETFTAKRRK
jgi:hypothetical protein